MPQVAAHSTVTIPRSGDGDRTLTLAEVGGPSAFMVSDAVIRVGPPMLTGPRAAGSRPVRVPRNMSVLIENLGDNPIDWTIT
jgi:hypothetical protein